MNNRYRTLILPLVLVLFFMAQVRATEPPNRVFPWISAGNISDPESLFIHTDRNIYIAGEVVRFSLYLLDNPSYSDDDRSKVAYIEIINSSNTPVAEYRAGIHGSFSEGLIRIPDSVTTGAYYLRAYTSLMKNYGPEVFFKCNNKLVLDSTTRTNVPLELSLICLR